MKFIAYNAIVDRDCASFQMKESDNIGMDPADGTEITEKWNWAVNKM